jgi:hypothetical protein
MPNAYPHKQTVFIFIICAIILMSIIWYVFGSTLSNKQTSSIAENMSISSSTNQLIDANYDWKKSFFDNSLTKKGSYDTSNTVVKKEENLTDSDKLGRLIFTEYAKIKQSGQSTDEKSLSKIANDIIDSSVVAVDQSKVFTKRDVVVIPNNDLIALRDYGNRVGGIITNYSPQRNDAYIAFEGIKQGDSEYVDELNNNIAKYESIMKLLTSVPTPSILQDAHLNLLNGVSKLQFIAKSLTKSATDPMSALSSLNYSKEAMTLVITGVQTIKKALVGSNIKYSSIEGGYYFTKQ